MSGTHEGVRVDGGVEELSSLSGMLKRILETPNDKRSQGAHGVLAAFQVYYKQIESHQHKA